MPAPSLGAPMPNPFCAAFLLAFEAQKVIQLRLVRIAWGGAEAQAELVSMVGEKVVAAMEAANTLMAGGTHGRGRCALSGIGRRQRAPTHGLDTLRPALDGPQAVGGLEPTGQEHIDVVLQIGRLRLSGECGGYYNVESEACNDFRTITVQGSTLAEGIQPISTEVRILLAFHRHGVSSTTGALKHCRGAADRSKDALGKLAAVSPCMSAVSTALLPQSPCGANDRCDASVDDCCPASD